MEQPTEKQITEFIRKEFPRIVFDKIKMNKVREGNCSFDVVLNDKSIAQSYEYRAYYSARYYWERVRNHLKWSFEPNPKSFKL